MAKSKGRLERNEQADILKDLVSYGKYVTSWKHEKTNDDGVPDIFFTSCLTGACTMEVKRVGEEVEGVQLYRLIKLNQTGVKAFGIVGYNGYLALKKKFNMNLVTLKRAHDKFNDNFNFETFEYRFE